jgi:hypothetical protein
MAAKKQAGDNTDLRTNEKKWTKPLMDAGWTALPSVIIENQRQLGLNPLDLNIILYLASKWWTAEGRPYRQGKQEQYLSPRWLDRCRQAVRCRKAGRDA